MEEFPISESQKHAVTEILGEWGWILLIVFSAMIFRDSIQNVVSGILIFIGNDLNHDDWVILDGRPSRIARCSLLKTTFYLYTIDKEGNFVNGTRTQIANVKLVEHSIEKPLPNMSAVMINKFKDRS